MKICLFLITYLILAMPLHADDLSWFTLLEDAAESWEEKATEDHSRLIINPRTPSEGSKFSVMVLFPKKSSAYDIAMAQILNEMTERKMNSRFILIFFGGDPQKGLAALDYAKQENCDLILSMGSESTSFVNETYKNGPIPVVTVCSKDPVLMGLVSDYAGDSKSNIAYTSLDVPTHNQLAYLKQLNKNLSQVGILYAADNISAVKTQVEPFITECEKVGISTFRVVVDDEKNAKTELETEMPAIVKKMTSNDPEQAKSIFWITGSTSVFNEIETINRQAQRIPVLSAVPNVVQSGDQSAVLSIGVSFENNAQLAALYAIRIMTRQTTAGELPVGMVSPPDIAINFKKARDIGLKIPFSFFESASAIYDHNGELVRSKGQNIKKKGSKP